MSVSFDTSSELEVTATLSDPTTWTHTPGVNPKGALFGFVHDTSETDHVNGVTYGGVALSELLRTSVAGGKPGACELWFRGNGLPTGPRTVSVDLTGAAIGDNAHFVMVTLGGDTDLEVIDSGILSDTADNNPEITLASLGRLCISLAMIYSGRNSPTLLTEISGCSRVQDMDLGASASVFSRQTTPGSSNFTMGWTALGAEVALVGVAISEVLSGAPPIKPKGRIYTREANHRASRW